MGHTNYVLKTDEIIGTQIYNARDEVLGKIAELVVDKYTGTIAYIVLESGTFLGLGGKLFAIPWHSVRFEEDKKRFYMNADKAQFEKAPGFDKDHWPNMADPTFAQTVSNYYNKSV